MAEAGGVTCPKCNKAIPRDFTGSYCPSCREVLPYEIESQSRQLTTGDGVSDLPESAPRSPVVRRYRDAYRVGSALVGLGNAIKIVGAVLGGIIVIGSLSSANSQFFGGGIAFVGFFAAAIVGGLFWVFGVVVAAQGQILRATLDNAVASSHFLTDLERADAMGLPRSATEHVIT